MTINALRLQFCSCLYINEFGENENSKSILSVIFNVFISKKLTNITTTYKFTLTQWLFIDNI